MNPIPMSDNTVMVRTDFTNDAAWHAVSSAIHKPAREDQAAFSEFAKLSAMIGQEIGELRVYVDLVDDPQYAEITTDQVLDLIPSDSNHVLLFIADDVTCSHPDMPILVVDLGEERGRTFRTVPAQVFSIESNLSIANCDWEDFADYVDKEGIYRGMG